MCLGHDAARPLPKVEVAKARQPISPTADENGVLAADTLGPAPSLFGAPAAMILASDTGRR
jgi:hypothetical protein